ncbi:MAG: ABC transporter permease/substrate-binding protein [Rhizomicrobium sp.]
MSAAFGEAWALLPNYLGQHVVLSLSALCLGLAISLPLGILAARRHGFGAPLLALVSVIQTIPGLALLALFYPLLLALSSVTGELFGVRFRALGFLPALLALTLYAMLPVLRNLVTALKTIDPAILMAAKGVGMTARQSLFKVELPLAAPQLLAGIRTATVWVVGITTLSTAIGQTSLGNYIFTGLQTENWVFVLFGCVAAALLALVLDFLLATAGDALNRGSRSRLALAGLGVLLVLIAALVPGWTRTPGRQVVIGAKNFDEQYILADVMADRLAHAGFAVSQKIDLGSTVALRALAASDIDAYVEYSGTLWGDAMHRSDLPGRKAMLREIKDWLARRYGILDMGTLGFENAYVFAMRPDRARALHITSLADVSRHPDLVIGGDFEIFSRPEWRRVAQAYGLKAMRRRQYQPDFLYRAVMGGDADLVSAFSSDGRIAGYHLTILADPKGALPPYDAMLLVDPAHAHDRRFLQSLAPLIGAIPLPLMQRANLMVDRDRDKRTPAEVGRWLEGHILH